MAPEFTDRHERGQSHNRRVCCAATCTRIPSNPHSLFSSAVVIGQFHKLSGKHLHRYLAEFEYLLQSPHGRGCVHRNSATAMRIQASALRGRSLRIRSLRLAWGSWLALYLRGFLRRLLEHLAENCIELALIGFHVNSLSLVKMRIPKKQFY